jgi:hypothetical protein
VKLFSEAGRLSVIVRTAPALATSTDGSAAVVEVDIVAGSDLRFAALRCAARCRQNGAPPFFDRSVDEF